VTVFPALTYRLPSAPLAVALTLPLLLACGAEEVAQAQNTGPDSVVAAILGSVAGDPPPRSGSPRISNQGQEAQPLQIADMGFNQGSPDAPIKVLEFTDFGCGYCRRFHSETYPTLKEVYVDGGFVEWKHVPFVLGMFPNGLEAGMAGECGGEQDEFFAMHARLFQDQPGWKGSDDPNTLFIAIAEEEGLDGERLKSCIEGGWRENQMRANLRLGREFGVQGTPTFIIDNRRLPGALPLDGFRDVLDMILTEKGITPPVR